MTDIYFIGCRPQAASIIRESTLIGNKSPGPDPGYNYWQLKPYHGDMDLMDIEEQWSILGDPVIPDDVKRQFLDDMQQAATFRYELYQLFMKILRAGDTPQFIDNNLGLGKGEWTKFSQPESITLAALLGKSCYHGDQWYVVTSEK